MAELTCAQCGAPYSSILHQCPACGAAVQPVATTAEAPRDARVCALLEQARHHQHTGDLTRAIRAAREALAMRPECCTVHALLGMLYEQAGDLASSRQHFQHALTVPDEAEDCPPPLRTPAEHLARRPALGGWMMLLLIACVLTSGLAVVFTLWPSENGTRSGTLVHILPRIRRVTTPFVRWDRHVPTPVPKVVTPPAPAPLVPDTADRGALLVGETQAHPAPLTPAAPPRTPDPAPATPPTVLGPSAVATAPIEPSEPTLEQAEQAAFRGQYERAIGQYEALAKQEKSNPHLPQKLAWCYQQLGNAAKAEEYLTQAIQGYRALLVDDPRNTALHQELRGCEASLNLLRNPRDPAP